MSDLITRYRPNSFDFVYGHHEVKTSLQEALKERRSHNFLFTGPSGIGKTTLARIVAKTVGAKIVEVDAGIYSGVEDTREITKEFKYNLLDESGRCYIINEVQALSKRAWDALLMSMEDHADWLWFCFTTTESAKVPETVKTRCLCYNLHPLDTDDLSDLLEAIRDAESLETPDEILDLCSRRAQGSPRAAISNYSLVLATQDFDEAAKLLEDAEKPSEVIDFVRALIQGADWTQLQSILSRLKETNPESIRHVCRAYLTTAILESKWSTNIGRLFQILEEFSEPFPDQYGLSPVLRAVGRILYAP